MSDAPLRLDRVTRIYKQAGRELVVFRDVSLALKSGEIVALVGQSGAGKSSLLHIAGLLEAPSSGEVYVQGEAVTRLPERRRTEIRRAAPYENLTRADFDAVLGFVEDGGYALAAQQMKEQLAS